MKKALFVSILLLIPTLLFSYTKEEMEGTWYLACKTPIGIREGRIEAEFSTDTDFSGIINMFGHDNEFSDGFFFIDTFFFAAKVRFLFSNIDFDAVGTIISSGEAEAEISTSVGNFPAVAYKSEEKLKEALERKIFN